MLLENRNAVVYGGGGAIGGAVARRFAREGATVFLAGRTLDSLDAVADDIHAAGGVAETARVDALDKQAVERHADAVVEKAGRIDVSFNAISLQDVQTIALVDMELDDFKSPITVGTSTHFLTATAAARHMIERGSGVILTLSSSAVGPPNPQAAPKMGGFSVACAAIEALTKNLAAELGPHGIRVACLRPEGIPESWEGLSFEGWSRPPDEIKAELERSSVLGRVPTLADVANVAAFMASDQASAMTATVANLTCGTVID